MDPLNVTRMASGVHERAKVTASTNRISRPGKGSPRARSMTLTSEVAAGDSRRVDDGCFREVPRELRTGLWGHPTELHTVSFASSVRNGTDLLTGTLLDRKPILKASFATLPDRRL